MFNVIERFCWDDISETIIASCDLEQDAVMICDAMKSKSSKGYSYRVEKSKTNGSSIPRELERISENICDNFCKYHDTCEGYFQCEYTNNGGVCPMLRLNF